MRQPISADSSCEHRSTVKVSAIMGMRYSDQQKELIAAARLGDAAALRALVDASFDVDCELKYGSSALMIAASRGHEECVRILASAGAKANRRNRFGATALMEAAEKGHFLVVRALVELGAEINLPHNNGTTVLMAATLRRDVKMIRLLLELGASPDVENFDGWSARKWAAAEANRALMDVFGLLKDEEAKAPAEIIEVPAPKPAPSVTNDAFWTAFMRAASVGDAPSLRRLADDGVEINGQSPNGTTALIAAAKNGKKESVLELIELGADLNIFDAEGLTAIAWAAKNGQTMIVQALKERGAGEPNANVEDASLKADDTPDAPSA